VSINKPLESRHRGIVTPFLLKIHVNKMQTHTRNAKP
jgi:hypothetical protein